MKGIQMVDTPLLRDLLRTNTDYAEVFDRSKLVIPPAKKLAIVACMDARLTVEDFLGLRTGDAHIIRNAGGIVTEDAVRSLIISHELEDLEENVRTQVERIRTNPFLPKDIPVTGFVYDVRSGKLNRVT